MTWRPAAELTPNGGLLADLPTKRLPPQPDLQEVYLRVVALDLEDANSIFTFARRYGTMGTQGRKFQQGSYFWIAQGLTGHPAFYEVQDELRAAEDRALNDPWDEPARWLETVDDFRFGATSIRDLVRAWRWANEGVEAADWECPIWRPVEIDDDRRDRWPYTEPPTSTETAATFLAQALGPGLEPFHPQVLLGDASQSPYQGRRPPTLYEACCLQLYIHIAENATYRVCANESCGRLFVRQSGRAKYGQHRTGGVKYCTVECARAQAQRQYRRRKSDQPPRADKRP
jgi:hypothetical protein